MASTDFINGTVIEAAWLNDVDDATYVANKLTAPAYAARSAVDKFSDVVSVKDFGATGDGITDDTVAIQAAIDSVCPVIPTTTRAGKVYFPRGTYRITSTLDITNNRVSSTRSRDGLSLEGDSCWGSAIIGETGSGKAIIETTGTQWFKMDKIGLFSGSSNKSTIGVLQALGSTLQQTQNQTFTNCLIYLHSDATANSNLGTIAVYNFGSEECTYHSLYTTSDRGIILTSSNDGTQPGGFTLTSYQTLATTHSLGMTTFSGECALISAGNRYGPQITVQNIGPCDFQNTYIGGSGTLGSNTEAIVFLGNAVGFKYKGVIEGMSSVRCDGSLINSDLDIDWGGVYVTTEAALRVNRANSSIWSNCNIRVHLESATTRPILSTTDGDETSTCLYSISNTLIRARASGAPNLYLPLNIAKNVGTYNNKIWGANYRPTEAAFAAGLTTTLTNATGDGTIVGFNTVPWTEVYDSSNTFDSSVGVFTAPVNGQYEFNASIAIDSLLVGHTDYQVSLQAGANEILLSCANPYAIKPSANKLVVGGSTTVYLSADDDVYIKVSVSGSTKTVSLLSGGPGNNWRTRFEGKLIY